MFDSIDLIIYNIKWIDFKKLRSLGIVIKSKKLREGKTYWFKYKNIDFKFNPIKKYILIITKVKVLLENRDVKLRDKETYRNIVLEIVQEIIEDNINMKLSRVDYCIDIPLTDDEELKIYIKILKKYKHKYRYMRLEKSYATSLYLTNRYGQFKLNFYDKYAESKNPLDKNILRLEIQVNAPKLNKEAKNGIPKTLDEYWSKKSMEKYYFDVLKGYIYEGRYYKIGEIYKVIKKSNLEKDYKIKLKKFVKDVNKEGIYGIIETKLLCRRTIEKYIKMLVDLGINPVPIPNKSNFNELENLYYRAIEIAETRYFI